MKKFLPNTPSEIFLIAVNILPMGGVLFWEWQVFDLLVIFWLENVIIGLMNILKMASVSITQKKIRGIFMIAFFILHYGIFTEAHGLFIFSMFGDKTDISTENILNPLLFIDTIHGFEWAIMALFASHLFSFFTHFIVGREIERTSLGALMAAPYWRVVVLHITIISWGLVAMATDNAVWALLVLTLIKTIGDMIAHRRSHEKLSLSSKM